MIISNFKLNMKIRNPKLLESLKVFGLPVGDHCRRKFLVLKYLVKSNEIRQCEILVQKLQYKKNSKLCNLLQSLNKDFLMVCILQKIADKRQTNKKKETNNEKL
ncbi:hypothetical protein BpHYR1_039013 [Brachionus plicatilis]|uniref:Uncharacterized protein n=1 Tax=Brachionus plicatilis TaxID=10195 RepID=A0A3M7T1A4_BRAPC|nr:hypothetical protein BpHYR1_039013 [Brachionus plicatilis]